MADKKVPCYGCERREPLCHSSCEDYKRFCKAREEEAKAIRKKRADEAMVTGVFINSVKRNTKDINANRQSAWRK